MAKANGYQTTLLEAHDEKPLGELIYPALRSLLFELDRVAGAGNKVKRGLAVLRSSVGSIKVTVGDVALGLDIEPAKGTADSGDLEIDLSNLLVAIAEAAEERHSAIAILVDAAKALRDPARALGVEFQDDALTEVYRLTRGYYSYLLQEWGYQA